MQKTYFVTFRVKEKKCATMFEKIRKQENILVFNSEGRARRGNKAFKRTKSCLFRPRPTPPPATVQTQALLASNNSGLGLTTSNSSDLGPSCQQQSGLGLPSATVQAQAYPPATVQTQAYSPATVQTQAHHPSNSSGLGLTPQQQFRPRPTSLATVQGQAYSSETIQTINSSSINFLHPFSPSYKFKPSSSNAVCICTSSY